MPEIDYLELYNMAKHLEFAKEAEDRAARFLKQKGYIIVKRNWRFGHLEIDIIAIDPRTSELVIVEVKARAFEPLINPEEAVDKKKRRFLVKAANEYVISNDLDVETRFDIIAIEKAYPDWEIEHFEDAFLSFE